jgi:hypothetical protein
MQKAANKKDEAAVAKHPSRRDETNIQQYNDKASTRDDTTEYPQVGAITHLAVKHPPEQGHQNDLSSKASTIESDSGQVFDVKN